MKNGVKNIQTTGYNGARTHDTYNMDCQKRCSTCCWFTSSLVNNASGVLKNCQKRVQVELIDTSDDPD